ncbi:Aminotransferase class I and II [Actinomadura mexicana]|uniref:Aminotransferase class I and II n=1 Tax=Actinomadura mexicana TaxID=134959 RepID=A0A238XN46_9ACTN|nr:Aminotransferase class I and II [Actinomadura mexicana]
MGNGSTELITWIDHLLVRESIATPIPTFGRWTDQPLETGKRVDMFQLHEMPGFELDVDAFVRFVRARGSRAAVVCNPNNPDGGYVPRREIVRLLYRAGSPARQCGGARPRMGRRGSPAHRDPP